MRKQGAICGEALGEIRGNWGEIGANCQGNRKTQCVFSMVSAKEKHRTPCVSKFSAKGSTKPQPAERGGGRIRAWDPRSCEDYV